MCRTVLEDNTATRWVLDLSGMPPPPFAPWIPGPVWRALLAPISRRFVWLTVAMYDQPVRDLMGQAINLGFHLLPRRRRMHPRTRDGYDRAPTAYPPTRLSCTRLCATFPPPAQRDNPMHYCPVHASRRA